MVHSLQRGEMRLTLLPSLPLKAVAWSETTARLVASGLPRSEVILVKGESTSKVRYAELLPHEFEVRLRERPVGYLPLGTLEWHGPQSPLGADFTQADAILARAAASFGGIVLPRSGSGRTRSGRTKTVGRSSGWTTASTRLTS